MADPVKTSGRPRRLWQVVLVCSLALNLAVAGVVAGTLVSGRMGDRPPRSFDLGIGPVAQALTPQERRAVGRGLREAGALRDVDLRGRVRSMIAVIQTEPFDAEALRGLFADQSEAMAGAQSEAQVILVQTIAAMTPERRAAFAADLADALQRLRDRRGSGG